MKILVFGGTGMLGKPVVNQLMKAGFDVTVASRNTHEATQTLSGVKIVEADLEDKKSIRSVIQGQDIIYLNLSVAQTEKHSDFHTETDGIKNLLEVVEDSSVKRIAYLSSLVKDYQGQNDFSWWVFDVKNQAISLLKKSTIQYTIFYPSCFMESFLGTQKRGNRILVVGKYPVKPHYIAGEDYGKQVVKSFQVIPENESREYVIQGLTPMMQHKAAEVFVKNYTKQKLKISIFPTWFMKLMSYFGTNFEYGYNITRALNEYDEKFEAQRTWQELGKPTINIAEFARKI